MTVVDELRLIPMRVIRQCFGKQAFQTPQAAHRALRNQRSRRRPKTLNVYRCDNCHRFHIGNTHEI